MPGLRVGLVWGEPGRGQESGETGSGLGGAGLRVGCCAGTSERAAGAKVGFPDCPNPLACPPRLSSGTQGGAPEGSGPVGKVLPGNLLRSHFLRLMVNGLENN